MMKLAKINPKLKVRIKAVSIITWSLFIFVANTQNWLIEFYLISIATGIICYFAFDNKSSNRQGTIFQRNQSLIKGPRREKYLNVFFAEAA